MQFKSLWLLIFSWLVGLIGLLLGLFVEPIWFARFGSLIVLLGAMSEYTLLHNELDVLYYAYQNNALNFAGLATAHASKALWNKLFTSCLLLKR